jgi:hypothetical protein
MEPKKIIVSPQWPQYFTYWATSKFGHLKTTKKGLLAQSVERGANNATVAGSRTYLMILRTSYSFNKPLMEIEPTAGNKIKNINKKEKKRKEKKGGQTVNHSTIVRNRPTATSIVHCSTGKARVCFNHSHVTLLFISH